MAKKDLNMRNLLLEQMQEDRKELKETFKWLKENMLTMQDYSVNGQTLAKFAELLQKQTAQVADFVKHSDKQNEDEDISPEALQDMLENDKSSFDDYYSDEEEGAKKESEELEDYKELSEETEEESNE